MLTVFYPLFFTLAMVGLTENIFGPQTNFKWKIFKYLVTLYSRKYFQAFGCVEENATENRRTTNGCGDPQLAVAESSNSGGWQLEIRDIN